MMSHNNFTTLLMISHDTKMISQIFSWIHKSDFTNDSQNDSTNLLMISQNDFTK